MGAGLAGGNPWCWRCKEIWVEGADRWRNPEHDLPADFDDRRTHYYAQLSKPLDASKFLGTLRQEMTTELAAPAGHPAASELAQDQPSGWWADQAHTAGCGP